MMLSTAIETFRDSGFGNDIDDDDDDEDELNQFQNLPSAESDTSDDDVSLTDMDGEYSHTSILS